MDYTNSNYPADVAAMTKPDCTTCGAHRLDQCTCDRCEWCEKLTMHCECRRLAWERAERLGYDTFRAMELLVLRLAQRACEDLRAFGEQHEESFRRWQMADDIRSDAYDLAEHAELEANF